MRIGPLPLAVIASENEHETWDDVALEDTFAPQRRAPVRPLTQIAVAPENTVNHGRNVTFTPKYAFRPNTNIDELVSIMKWAGSQSTPLRIKAGGSLHSWSTAAASPNAVYIQPQGMVSMSHGAECARADVRQEDLFHFGAGTTLKAINQFMWARKKAFPVMGGFDGQTIAGVFPTGTHGSVLSYGGLNELVRSIDMVTPAGEKVRLEPAQGITDARAFKLLHPDFHLVQNDEQFAAALVSMGTLGVIHSVTVAATDRFYLREMKTMSSVEETKRVLAGGNLYNLVENSSRPPEPTSRTFPGHPVPAYHLELWWNPHTGKMLTMSRVKVGAEEQAALEAHEPAEFTANPRNLARTLAARAEFARPKVPDVTTEFFGKTLTAVDHFVEQHLGKAFPKFLDLSLASNVDPEYVNRSYNVFHLGDGQSKMPAQSATFSVPLAGDQYLQALDIIQGVANRYAAQYGIYQTAPISLRFVKASPALLGEPVDACKFEIIFSGNDARTIKDAQALMTAYYRALRAQLGNDVRIHWGQTAPSDLSSDDVRATYPKLDRFLAVQKQFDPRGQMMNAWQNQLLRPQG